jgi:hypothetical protein
MPPLDPDNGATAGGTTVKITYGGPWDEETVMAIEVMFGDVAAQAVDGADPYDTDDGRLYESILATSPPHHQGDVTVYLIVPGNEGEAVATFKYFFAVSSVAPNSAEVVDENDWDVAVMITGNDMSDVQAVSFGNILTQFGLISPSYIWAFVPYPQVPIPAAGYPVRVTMKTSRGEDNSQTFTYTPTPSPSSPPSPSSTATPTPKQNPA